MCWLGKLRYLTTVLLLMPVVAAGTLRHHDQGVLAQEKSRELPFTSSSSSSSSYSRYPWAGGMVIVKSHYSFEETYSNLIDAISAGNTSKILAEIDHSAAAASVGLELLPNRLVIVGNPALGMPIMLENVLVGLDLPQKFLVWQQPNGEEENVEDEDDDEVFVGYNPPEYLVARYMYTENAREQLATMRQALSNLASMATGVDGDYIANALSPAVVADDVMFPSSRSHSGLFSVASRDDFETTRDRLVAALNEDGGANIALEVDHAANSNGVLLANSSYLIVFGNPTIGTPLMQISPTAGIDLPLKILITQSDQEYVDDGVSPNSENGLVHVTTNMIGYLRHRHNLWSLDEELLTTVQNAVLGFVGIATDKDLTTSMQHE